MVKSQVSVKLCYLQILHLDGVINNVFCVKIWDLAALVWLLHVMLGCADLIFMLLGMISIYCYLIRKKIIIVNLFIFYSSCLKGSSLSLILSFFLFNKIWPHEYMSGHDTVAKLQLLTIYIIYFLLNLVLISNYMTIYLTGYRLPPSTLPGFTFSMIVYFVNRLALLPGFSSYHNCKTYIIL